MQEAIYKKFDWPLLMVTLILSGISIATFYLIDPSYNEIITRQIVLVSIGILAFIGFSFFDYRIFKNNSLPSILFYVITVGLLLLTLTSPEIRGARAWTTVLGLRFEPSEIAKLAVLILLAKYFSQKHVEIYRTPHILASGIYAGIPAVITFLQSDLGSMIVFIALWLGMLTFSGINKKHLLAILMIGVVLASLAWFVVLQDYQKQRLASFIDPYLDPLESGYSTIQAKTTLGSGMLMGTLLGGREDSALITVPEPHTDFAFAALAQKFGFIGVIAVLGLLGFLLLRIGSITIGANNNFAKLYGLGLMMIIFIHIIINVGMNLGVMPITGIPLPFLSYGGSHLITLMIGLGLIQSIKMRAS
ncbi:MAG: FtsW/RodA/SpoVE family cell cycle protein [Parcubacteria group bacterium]